MWSIARYGTAAIIALAGGTSFAGVIAPAPVYGITPSNSNISPYAGVVSDPYIRWQVDGEAPSIDSPALILDGHGVIYRPNNPAVLASNGHDAGLGIPSDRESTPAIDASGNVYQWYQGRLHAYAPSGAPLWTGPTTNFSDGNGVKLLPNGTILAGGGDHAMFGFSPQGALLWSAPSYAGNDAPPAIDPSGNSYFADREGVRYASYDCAGNLRWSVVGVGDGHPARLGPDGNVYISSNFGTVVDVLRQDTGALVRQQANLYGGIQAIGPAGTLYSCSYQTVTATDPLGATLWQSHIPSTSFFERLVVDAAGKVYCTTEENELYAYSSTGTQLWRMLLPAAGAQNLCPIIGSDGAVYMQDGNFLVAIGGTVPAPGAGTAIVLLVGFHTVRRRR